jgi:hypothetical protein
LNHFNMTLAVRTWILCSAWVSGAGWILSVVHQLNPAGYAILFVLTAVFFLRDAKAVILNVRPFFRNVGCLWRKFRQRFKCLAPLLFLALAVVSVAGGLLACPQNGDTNAYRVPRVLHWIGQGGWHWIRTADSRMNIAGCAYEWLITPLILFTRTDRWIFLPNVLSYLLLPGLIFSVFRRMQVSPRVAWWWMWFLSTGWCYVQQACSTNNDSLGAVYALAAVDFALRARASRKVADLWLSMLAAGLLTGLKPTNLPLLLPWAIAALPSARLLLTRPLKSFALAGFGLLVSVAPLACLCWMHTGSWKGYSPGQIADWGAQQELHSPVWGILGNTFCLTAQNLLPPFFPWAGAWNNAMQHFLQTSLGAHFTSFESFGHLARSANEASAGIGLGVVLAAVIVIFVPRQPKATTSTVKKDEWLLWWLRLSPWLALLVFMAKVGTYGNARQAAPYYALLLPMLLVRPGQNAFTRRRWWQRFLLLCMLFTVAWMAFARGRQIVPATLMADLHAKYPEVKTLAVLNDYYASNLSAASARRFLQKNNIYDGVVGYATTYGGSEPGMWFPLGTVRVERVLPTDGTAWFRSHDIHYVVVEDLALKTANETIAEWMQRQQGSLVGELIFKRDPGAPPGHQYLVHLSPPVEAGRPLQ